MSEEQQPIEENLSPNKLVEEQKEEVLQEEQTIETVNEQTEQYKEIIEIKQHEELHIQQEITIETINNTTQQITEQYKEVVQKRKQEDEYEESLVEEEHIIEQEKNHQEVEQDNTFQNEEYAKNKVENQETPKEPGSQDHLTDQFFYDENELESTVTDSQITRQTVQYHKVFGFDSMKKYNVSVLDNENIIYSCGVTYQILNINTLQTQVLFSKDGGGIGSIAVHPSKKYFAVAEKGNKPNIYIYEYPTLKLFRILRKGTELSYSSVTFSFDGIRCASVGSSPDYTISIWDWKKEMIILKAKAFSQEVYHVQFSEYSENILATSGLAHIKFWKVAETFTGLKLKGEIAKFGQVELSDVIGYYIHPDGKVLSGTEYGNLLLWEGNLIKCVIFIDEQNKCHDGCINAIFKIDNNIITAGEDGYIRFWDFQSIENSESDDFGNFYLKPTNEILIKTDENRNANISQVLLTDNYWIVIDFNGKIIKLCLKDNYTSSEQTTILETNSGKLNDIAVSPTQNASVTIGDDGVVRLWDFVNKREYYSRKFPSKGTCVEWLAHTRKNGGRVVVVGYQNGIVRYLLLNQITFTLLKSLKVHNKAIKYIKASPDGSIVAVLSIDGNLFLLENDPSDIKKLEPICLFDTKLQINSMVWDRNGEKLLFAAEDGKIYETQIPKKENCDTSETYLQNFYAKSYTIKMMEFQKPKTEEMELEFLLRRNKNEEKKEEVEWEPDSIMNACYYDYSCTKILATVSGKYMGWIYLIDWNKDRPIEAIPVPKIQSLCMNFVDFQDILLIGFKDGSWQLRHKNDIKIGVHLRPHDIDYGAVKNVCLNFMKNCILSVGGDGTFSTYKVDMEAIKQICKGNMVENFIFADQFEGGSISENTFSEKIIEEENQEEEDILDDNVYSIQEAKLLAEEDYKKQEANKKKNKILEQVQNLVSLFEDQKRKNLEIDEIARLTNQELCVDPDYIEMLNQRVEQDLEETKLELKWDAEYYQLKTQKLFKYMKDELIVDTFTVKAIKNPNIQVSTFKVKKMSDFLRQNLQEIQEKIDQIEEERRIQEEIFQKSPQNNLNLNDQTIKNQTFKKEVQNLQNTMSQQQQQQLQLQQQQEDIKKKQQQQQQQGNEKKGEQTHFSLSKQEKLENKLKQQRLKKELEELSKKKPTKESFDPDHQKDIENAKKTLGDYKLKSSPTYDVPENQRMNVSKKKKNMFLREEFIYNMKIKMNNEIIALRERKKNILEKINDYNQKIQEINKQLNINETLFQPKIDKQLEMPETFFQVTEEQIDAFIISKNKENAQNAKNKQTQENEQQNNNNNNNNNQQKKEKKPDPTLGYKQRKGVKVQNSEQEEELKTITQMILNAEKKRMQDEINEETEQFDKDVLKWQNEKNIMESDITIAQMKLVTFFQELLILADMEEQDEKLINDLLNLQKDKSELEEQNAKIVADLVTLANKDSQNEKELVEQQKAFKELIHPDDDVKREKIHQYYLRKYKKNKAKQQKLRNAEEENEDFEEEDIESDEDDDDDFLDDEDDEKPDISPVENDSKIREIIDKICELEDQQENKRKEKSELDRQKVSILSKIANIGNNLRKAEEELKNYQRKKLQKVNQLDVSYCLKTDQIQNINILNQGEKKESYKLPDDLSRSILFTQDEFNKIAKRIKELKLEQERIKKSRANLEKKQKVLQVKLSKKNAEAEEQSEKCREKHFLKFGDVMDLSTIEQLEPTKQVLEMRERFKEEERQSIIKLERAKQQLQERKNYMLQAKKENTAIITSITKLGEHLMKLSKKLDLTGKQLFQEDNEEKKNKQDLEQERQQYKDLVRFLAKEIEDLKTEIGLFKRKGGHIYTMVTSNKKNFN